MKSFSKLTWLFPIVLMTAGVAAAAKVPDAGKPFYLSEEPEDAADVIFCRKEVKDGDKIVVVGRIGGRKNPWVKNACAFSLVDRKLVPCNENEGENCPTPWDYCCSPNLAQSMVLVMIVDDQSKLVRKDARELLGISELDTVMIQGTAKRDKSGNLTILGSRIFVPSEEQELQ